MRALLIALLIGAVTLPAYAVQPVKGAVKGTVQAGSGVVRGTGTAARGVGHGVKCVFTLGTRC